MTGEIFEGIPAELPEGICHWKNTLIYFRRFLDEILENFRQAFSETISGGVIQ